MTKQAALREQHGELMSMAIDVARFAARLSSDWICMSASRPSPMGVEARKQLRDSGPRAAAAMRAATAQLRAAEQAVSDARKESDHVYEGRCRKRDALVKAAEKAAAAAPATAVRLFDEQMERDHSSSGTASDAAGAHCRRLTTLLAGIVQPILNKIEGDLSAQWLRERMVKLRRLLASYEASVSPFSEALARKAPEGGRRCGRWCEPTWSGVLIHVVGDLLRAVDAGDEELLRSAISALKSEQLAVDLAIEFANLRGMQPESASEREAVQDGWGPDLTFRVVCQVILDQKRASSEPLKIIAGDSALRETIMQAVRAGDLDKLPLHKASQYLTPQGRLSELGWVRRAGSRVRVTESGAERWKGWHLRA